MKHLATLTVAALCLAVPALAADPVEGLWKTRPDDNGNFGHVRIYDCSGALCGTIEKAFDAAGTEVASPNIGKRMIWDMKATGNGAYSGGKIWAPDRDKTYNSKMSLSGSTLSVAGCVAGGLICRDQAWTRVE
ncbi:DUF2147 domain-containing protein [Palleronia sp. KMU-117]|uniref:DUF2147 domain-containing protein n=1 Tax=Palleronia sp. KMU-117 TaxID=3434108 RepID=UPI003D749CB0